MLSLYILRAYSIGIIGLQKLHILVRFKIKNTVNLTDNHSSVGILMLHPGIGYLIYKGCLNENWKQIVEVCILLLL